MNSAPERWVTDRGVDQLRLVQSRFVGDRRASGNRAAWRAAKPETSPQRRGPRPRCHSPAGRTSWARQVRLRQIRRHPAQDQVLLLQQMHLATQLTILAGLGRAHDRPAAVVDLGDHHPLCNSQCRRWGSGRRVLRLRWALGSRVSGRPDYARWRDSASATTACRPRVLLRDELIGAD